jgi:TonB family protein
MRTCLAALLLTLPSAAHAQTPSQPALQPQGPWKVDYAPEECRLVRTFGAGDQQIVMRLARGSGLQQFDMVLAGTSIPKLSRQVKMSLRLDGQGKEQQFDGYSAQVPNRPERFVRWYDGESDLLQEFTDNQAVTVAAGPSFSVRLNLVAARSAIKALDACHADLLASWGLDVASLKAAKSPPRPTGNPGNWATSSDYPSRALRLQKGGAVRFLLVVGPDGKPTQCKIAFSSGIPELDNATCRLVMLRAKFRPAMNAEQQPITGYYVNRVRWVTPSD